ncbi:MAG: CHAT domain-containing protein, partial [Alphaproteobacteria bacterium]|nr:CHAT domain-containing protein [Alphaproteobacteria bacterium]
MRARLSFLYGVVLAIAIAPWSAPHAQTATASLPAAQPAPPPRTVKDILDGLARQSANLAKLDGDRAVADTPIPEGGDPTQRIKGLHDRGLAAERVGRARQALDDLNAAVKLAEAAPYASKPKLAMDLSQVEIMSGNALRGLELRKAAIASSTEIGQRIVWNANLAVSQTYMGDLEASDASLARAEEALRDLRGARARSELVPFWQAIVHRARGAVLATRGKPADAEAEYQRAVTILNGYGGRDLRDREGREVPIHRFLHGTVMDRAINLMALDRPIEAELMAREALTGRLSRSDAESGDVAYFLQRLSFVVGEQGRADDAIAIARAALDIYGRTGAPKESLPANMSRLRLAANLMLKRKWREARAEADAMRQDLSGEGDLWLRRFGGHPDLTLVALKTGDVTTAKTMAARYVQRATGRLGARHYNSAEANGLLAMAAAAEGKNKEALALYAQALPVLLARSRQSQEDSGGRAMQDFRRAQILQGYLDLLAAIAGTPEEREAGLNASEEAFRIADVVRGQSVQQALARSAARASASDPALADLARREQDAQREIAGLNGILSGLLSVSDGQGGAAAINALRARIDALRAERGKLASEIEAKFPSYAELVNPKPATVAEVRAALKPGEALIAFYVGESQSYVWAVPKDGPVGFARIALGADKLADAVGLLRSALDPNASTIEEIPAFDVAAAHGLYKAFLEPVAPSWQGAKTLLVVPHGAWGFLPLSVLPTKAAPLKKDGQIAFASYREVAWLARSHAVANLPSAASLKALRALPAASAQRQAFVGFGDPWFNAQQAAEGAKDAPALAMRGGKVALVRRNASRMAEADSTRLAMLPRLADTRTELLNIARALKADPSQTVFLGKEANEERVKTMALKDYRILAFATHGLVPGE